MHYSGSHKEHQQWSPQGGLPSVKGKRLVTAVRIPFGVIKADSGRFFIQVNCVTNEIRNRYLGLSQSNEQKTNIFILDP